MKLKQVTVLGLLAIVLAVMCGTQIAQAQAPDASLFWIRVYSSDAPTVFSDMRFGNRIGMTTTGIDTGAIEPFKEAETPPPGLGFDCIWAPPTASRFGTGVRGLLGRDYRGYIGASQIDTFKLSFAQLDNTAADISFKWPDPVYIGQRCDSMVFVFGATRQNMALVDTLTIPAAADNGFTFAKIFIYGCQLVDTHVKLEDPRLPGSYSLQQNYPNPFNPTTTIKFAVEKSSVTEVAVFNILGQKVATLVNGELSPGTYSTVWNGTADNGFSVSSGVYFVRMSSQAAGAGAPFVALRKLLLMK